MYYILRHGHPVLETDTFRWARWFETHTEERVVARETVAEDVEVLTVFLGIDHSYITVFLGIDHSFLGGPPVLYETLVFGGEMDGEMDRYHTRDEAEAGHAAMVERVRAALA